MFVTRTKKQQQKTPQKNQCKQDISICYYKMISILALLLVQGELYTASSPSAKSEKASNNKVCVIPL
jgi:hypothetical protein